MNFLKTFLAGLLAFFAGSMLVSLFWMLMVVMVAGALTMQRTATVPEGAILEIDLAERITDSPSTDPLGGIDLMTLQTTPQLPLLKALDAIRAAQDDPRIEGIYLRPNGGGGVDGPAVLEELRDAVEAFRQSGKFVVAYNEAYSQGAYYLATAAERIYLQPEGGLDWSGLSSEVIFFKGLLDKLDVRAEVFRPTECRYKSAVEPFILKRMSDANREQLQEMVDSYWSTIAGAVAASRGIDTAKLDLYADRLEATLAEEALEKGFVDGLIYEDGMDAVFAEMGAEADADGEYRFVTLGQYAAQAASSTPRAKNLSAPRVAVVYADGEIVDGEGSGGAIYGSTLAATLGEVRDDEGIESVVVRVNSPGGSALASDVVWREMELLRDRKPVVVSMGSYAASGGYYIACPADVIVADRMTLTGSIGVFGMYLDTREALKNKLGITIDQVRSNASAGMGIAAPLTPLERATVQRSIDKVYATFTQHVANGRNLPLEKVLRIAEGRVWAGPEALEIGLVDALGGMQTAIAIAADKAGLGDDYRVVEITEQPTGLAAVLAALNMSVRSAFRSEADVALGEWRRMKEALGQQGIRAWAPYRVTLE